MKLDDIKASEPTVMTAELVRLFKFAGCEPTICHACGKRIRVGQVFRLVPFNGTDEMCCAKHGEKDLEKRSNTPRYFPPTIVRLRQHPFGWSGGYSRPSKPEAK